MLSHKEKSLSQRLLDKLRDFFPDSVYTLSSLEEFLHTGEIFYKPADILPFLQTALIDDKIIEVEMGGVTQLYFSRIYDHPPEPRKDESSEISEEYTEGDYLKKFHHLITLPLEPGMGNYNVRFSTKIVLRFFTSTYAVELGTYYQEQDSVQGLPVLRHDYPAIGRIVRGAREYRAKVPEKMNIRLKVIGKRKQKNFTTRLANMSVSGFAFLITKEQQNFFYIDEVRSVVIIVDDVAELKLKGNIRHITKIRGRKGTEFTCGFQADLETRAVASRLEEIVAQVQRAHLRELADLSQEMGIDMIR